MKLETLPYKSVMSGARPGEQKPARPKEDPCAAPCGEQVRAPASAALTAAELRPEEPVAAPDPGPEVAVPHVFAAGPEPVEDGQVQGVELVVDQPAFLGTTDTESPLEEELNSSALSLGEVVIEEDTSLDVERTQS